MKKLNRSKLKSKVSKSPLRSVKRDSLKQSGQSSMQSQESRTHSTQQSSTKGNTSVENLNETPKPDLETAKSVFETAMAESKQNLTEKREGGKKRGRHPKSCTCESCISKAQSLASDTGMPLPDVPGGMVDAIPIQVDQFVIGQALEFPYLIAAKRTGFDGFKLSDEEKQAIVPQLDACVKQYMPQSASPMTALIVTAATITVLSAMKYYMYLDFIAEKRKEQTEQRSTSPAVVRSEPEVIDPNNPFPTRAT